MYSLFKTISLDIKKKEKFKPLYAQVYFFLVERGEFRRTSYLSTSIYHKV